MLCFSRYYDDNRVANNNNDNFGARYDDYNSKPELVSRIPESLQLLITKYLDKWSMGK